MTGRAEETSANQGPHRRFAVVGLGASAGGLEALKAFFTKVPENSGLAYIVNVHQTPKQPSLMPELLQRVTPVPVAKAENGQALEPDHIYVVPSDKTLGIYHGRIQLFEIVDRHPMLPIDEFLKSLAEDQGAAAVAIILSGTGTDGSLGVKAIKGNDGLVLVQSEESADYNGMPRSAIGTGLADMVLPPGEMPARLIQYFAHPHVAVIHAPPLQAADSGKTDIAQLTRRAILERFTPTALLVDANGVILYVHGRTGKYLETTSGAPTYDVLNQAREGLRIELSSALRAAKTSRKTVVRRNVAVKTNGDVQTIDLHVFPLADPLELAGRFLVFFEDTEPPPPAAGNGAQAPNPDPKRIAALEKELQNTRESHQTTIEELESSNEELQSTNEELESSKEELQSLNEELQTVNAELQNKVEELSASHDDMRNLLNSTEIATIFVDNDLHVRRFTPKATAIINLIPADIGRPLKHVVSNLAREGMLDDLKKVLTSLAPRSREVQTTTGQWFKMNIIPYRTRDNRIGGAVLTFASIDEQKQVQQRLMDASESSHEMTRAWQLVRSVFDMITDPLAVLDSEGRIDIANTAFTKEIGIVQAKVKGINLLDIQNSVPERSELAEKLRHAVEKGEDFQIDTAAPAGKESGSRLKGRILRSDDEPPYRTLLQFVKKG